MSVKPGDPWDLFWNPRRSNKSSTTFPDKSSGNEQEGSLCCSRSELKLELTTWG